MCRLSSRKRPLPDRIHTEAPFAKRSDRNSAVSALMLAEKRFGCLGRDVLHEVISNRPCSTPMSHKKVTHASRPHPADSLKTHSAHGNRPQRMVQDAAGGRVAVSETLPQCTAVNVTFLMHLALYRRAGGTREHAYPDCIPVALTAARCGDQVCDPVCGRQLTSARPH